MGIVEEKLINEINAEEKQQGKKKPKAYNYFTFVWYPQDRPNLFKKGNEKLYNLGFFTFSPFHNEISDNYLIGKGKPHYHVLCKSANKQTENAFIKALVEALGNSLQGVAIHKGDTGVENVSLMLRYFLHLNNPIKEKFDCVKFYEECPIVFAEEYAKAFQTEIQVYIQAYIIGSKCTEFAEVLASLGNSNIIITEWLNQRKHMQLVYNLLNDNRKLLKDLERSGNNGV